jgi:hypothetical protein
MVMTGTWLENDEKSLALRFGAERYSRTRPKPKLYISLLYHDDVHYFIKACSNAIRVYLQ